MKTVNAFVGAEKVSRFLVNRGNNLHSDLDVFRLNSAKLGITKTHKGKFRAVGLFFSAANIFKLCFRRTQRLCKKLAVQKNLRMSSGYPLPFSPFNFKFENSGAVLTKIIDIAVLAFLNLFRFERFDYFCKFSVRCDEARRNTGLLFFGIFKDRLAQGFRCVEYLSVIKRHVADRPVSGNEPAFVGFNFVFSPIVIFDLNKCFERESVGAELITSIQAENPDRPTARNGENQFVFLFEKRRNVINLILKSVFKTRETGSKAVVGNLLSAKRE